MSYEWWNPPRIDVKVWSGILSKGDDPNYREVIVNVAEGNVAISGDWPKGTDTAKMRRDIAAAIMANIPKKQEGGAQ